MPVTKTAKRAMRSSERKAEVNKKLITKVEVAIRKARKSKKASDVKIAFSFVDRAAKKSIFHKNKAARIKTSLSKLISTPKKAPKGKKKASPKKASKK